MKDPKGYCMVLTTCPSQEEADRIACLLIEGRLAACVQATAITSCYRWKGEVSRDSELLLFIKAKAANYERIESCILENHSYEVPEIVLVPIEKGFTGYLRWIDETSGTDDDS
ncbi:MAG TPA: divalent-cation tolerance protein CutA [Deltaproteobacteria bacterium]|jgi:periplasmic divalent cation tolerance protein|nr:divalent-cation tolerance protein CutA [Deltaproteobacteria bacterium]HOI06628.1 divalent-cation tolerance protein CutA [Deltaproteobacteria bacterium]